MRKVLTWVAGLAGIVALVRRRSRPKAPLPAAAAAAGTAVPADPAVELRQKLDETRAGDSPPPPTPADEPLSLDERRARVHERAQDAISQMHSADTPIDGDDLLPEGDDVA